MSNTVKTILMQLWTNNQENTREERPASGPGVPALFLDNALCLSVYWLYWAGSGGCSTHTPVSLELLCAEVEHSMLINWILHDSPERNNQYLDIWIITCL